MGVAIVASGRERAELRVLRLASAPKRRVEDRDPLQTGIGLDGGVERLLQRRRGRHFGKPIVADRPEVDFVRAFYGCERPWTFGGEAIKQADGGLEVDGAGRQDQVKGDALPREQGIRGDGRRVERGRVVTNLGEAEIRDILQHGGSVGVGGIAVVQVHVDAQAFDEAGCRSHHGRSHRLHLAGGQSVRTPENSQPRDCKYSSGWVKVLRLQTQEVHRDR